MAVGYHRPYRLASAPPLTRHSLVALGLISRLGGLDHGIVQGHRGAVAEAEPRTMPQSFGLPCMLYLVGSLSNQESKILINMLFY